MDRGGAPKGKRIDTIVKERNEQERRFPEKKREREQSEQRAREDFFAPKPKKCKITSPSTPTSAPDKEGGTANPVPALPVSDHIVHSTLPLLSSNF